MKSSLKILVVLAIFSQAYSLNFGLGSMRIPLLGARRNWQEALERSSAEPEIVEVVRWRQPVCVVPGKDVQPCLTSLRKFQADYESTSDKGSEEIGSKTIAKKRTNVLSSHVVDRFDVENVDSVNLHGSEEDSGRSFEGSVTFNLRSSTPEIEKASGSRQGKYLVMSNYGKASTIVHDTPPAIYVTKVLNSPVTATLVANNCFPDIGVPLCDSYQETITIYKDPATTNFAEKQSNVENEDETAEETSGEVTQATTTTENSVQENNDTTDFWNDPSNPNFDDGTAQNATQRPTGLLIQAIQHAISKPGVLDAIPPELINALANNPAVIQAVANAGNTGNDPTSITATEIKPQVIDTSGSGETIEVTPTTSKPGLIGALLGIQRPAILDNVFNNGFNIFNRSSTAKPSAAGLLGQRPVIQSIQNFIHRPTTFNTNQKPVFKPILVVEPTRRPGIFGALWNPTNFGIFNRVSTSTARTTTSTEPSTTTSTTAKTTTSTEPSTTTSTTAKTTTSTEPSTTTSTTAKTTTSTTAKTTTSTTAKTTTSTTPKPSTTTTSTTTSKPNDPPADDPPTDDSPAKDPPAKDPPADDTPTDETKPADDTPTDETKPADDTPTDETKPADDTPTNETKPADDTPTNEKKPADDTPTNETKPADDTPTNQTKPANENTKSIRLPLVEVPERPQLSEILFKPENDISGRPTLPNIFSEALAGNANNEAEPTQAPGLFGGLFKNPARPSTIDESVENTKTILGMGSSFFAKPTNKPLVIERPGAKPLLVEKPIYVQEKPVESAGLLNFFIPPSNKPILTVDHEVIKDPVYVYQKPQTAPGILGNVFGSGPSFFQGWALFGGNGEQQATETRTSQPGQNLRSPVAQSTPGEITESTVSETVAENGTPSETSDTSSEERSKESEDNESVIDDEAVEGLVEAIEDGEIDIASTGDVGAAEDESEVVSTILVPEETAAGALPVENSVAAEPIDSPAESATTLDEIPENIASAVNAELAESIDTAKTSLKTIVDEPTVESSDASESSLAESPVVEAEDATAAKNIVNASETNLSSESENIVNEADNSEEDSAIDNIA